MNILLLSFYFPPMTDVGGLRAYSFAKYLSKDVNKFNITVIAGKAKDPKNIDLLDELSLCKLFYLENWFSGFSDISWSVIFKVYKIHQQKQFDLILPTAPPWSTIKTGFLLSKLLNIPLVTDFRDPWNYGQLWDLPQNKFISNQIQRWWENTIVKNSLGVVYTVPKAVEMHSHVLTKNNTIVIPNGYEDLNVKPLRPGNEGQCIFAHIGKLHQEVRRFDIILQALTIACHQNKLFASEFSFVQIGSIYDSLLPEVKQKQLSPQINFISAVSLKKAQEFMRGSDVLVLINPLANHVNKFESSKVYEYLSTKKPILAVIPENSPSTDLIARVNNAIICGNENAEKIAHGFIEMWTRWRQNLLREHNVDTSIYTRSYQATQLSKFLKKLNDG